MNWPLYVLRDNVTTIVVIVLFLLVPMPSSWPQEKAPRRETDAETVSFLRKELLTGDELTRKTVVKWLGDLGPKSQDAVFDLVDILVEPQDMDWEEVRQSLLNIGPPAGVECEKRLAKANAEQRFRLRSTLIEFYASDKDKLPRILSASLSDPDRKIRLDAAESIIRKHREKAHMSTPALIAMVQHEKTEKERVAALRAISAIGTEASPAIPFVYKILRDAKNNGDLRLEAVNTLGTIGVESRNVADILRAALIDEVNSDEIRLAIAIGLRQSKFRQSAMPELLKILKRCGRLEWDGISLILEDVVALTISELDPGTRAIPVLKAAFAANTSR